LDRRTGRPGADLLALVLRLTAVAVTVVVTEGCRFWSARVARVPLRILPAPNPAGPTLLAAEVLGHKAITDTDLLLELVT